MDDKFENYGIDGVNYTKVGNQMVRCPQPECTNRKKKGLKTLSINIAKQAWNCHHCGWSGHLQEAKKEEKPQPVLPRKMTIKVSDNVVMWFKRRHINLVTLERNKIGEGKQWMPQTQKEENCIFFNYFRNGELVNIKYRDGRKHFCQVKNAQKILYKLDDLKGHTWGIITEGEMDALSFEEVGYKNAVSVPDGAPNPKTKNFESKFEFLDNCHEELDALEKIYIAVDTDEPGILLRNEIARRVGKHRCYLIRYPEDCKDANEVLMKHGDARLKQCVEEAEPYPIEDIILVKDFYDEIDMLYNGGFAEGVKVGFNKSHSDKVKCFDDLISFKTSMLTAVTGIPSHGKALAIDTVIPTVNGPLLMKHICVGDVLFDEKGNHCKVTNVTGIMNERPCYRITFNDGTTVVADAEHQWMTDTCKSRRSAGNARRNGRDVERDLRPHGVDQTLKRTFASVKTTEGIAKTIFAENDNRHNHSIPVCGPVVGKERYLMIDPYVLGCWLGDGSSQNGNFTCADQQIIDNICLRGYEVSSQKRAIGYCIRGIKGSLRWYNLLDNKHIPTAYLASRYEDRLELLRGLMDTDGSIDKRGTCEFTSVNQILFWQVSYLICSLGMKPVHIMGDAKLDGRIVGRKFRIQFTPTLQVFNLSRKQDRVRDDYNLTKIRKRYIVSCERIDSVPVKCIEVDSDSHLFLCTESFIPTHNSNFTEQLALLLNFFHRWKVGIFSPEHYPMSLMFSRLAKMLIGKQFFQGQYTRMNTDELTFAKEYLNKNFQFIRPKNDRFDLETIMDAAKGLILRYGVRLIIIDPWNSIAHDKKGMNENDYIEWALNYMNTFKHTYDVHVMIVAHPTKMKKFDDGTHEVPSLYSISGCYSDDTEVLTDRGWLHHGDISNEKVACFNPDNGATEYHTPSRIIKKQYSGVMHQYRGYGYDLLVTPEHRMLVKPVWREPVNGDGTFGRPRKWEKGKWVFCKSEDMPSARFNIPRCGLPVEGIDPEYIDIDTSRNIEDFLWFVGFWIAEGSHQGSGLNICQAVGDVADYVERVMNRLGLIFSRREFKGKRKKDKKVIVQWYIGKTAQPEFVKWIKMNCGKGCHGKRIPDMVWELSPRLKRILMDGYIAGDGSVTNRGNERATTTSSVLRDNLMRMAIDMGIAVSSCDKPAKVGCLKSWQIDFAKPQRSSVTLDINRNRSEVLYNGDVWCLTVPTGAYFVRRNGKVSVCGNSAHWFNKVDYGMTVYRDFKRQETQVHVQKVKYEHLGQVGVCLFEWNPRNSRFHPKGTDPFNLTYGQLEQREKQQQEAIQTTMSYQENEEEFDIEPMKPEDLPF